VILFRGFDDPDSLTSISVSTGHLCWSWIEEFFQIHNEEDFNKLDLSLRGQLPDQLYIQVTGTMNAWNNLSWVKRRFFDRPDNDTFVDTTTYLQNEFLSVDDLKVFEKLRLNSPKRYLVGGLGQWGSCEGLIYADYVESPEKHHKELITADPSKNIAGEKLQFITIGLDYGSGTPDSALGKTVLSAVAITQDFKKCYCIKESYFNDVLLPDRITKWVKDFILELKSNFKLELILHCEYASSAALNNALIIALQGIGGLKIEDCYKSTILDRIDLVNYLIGQNRLFFTEAVPRTKAGFASALWDQEKGKLKGIPIRLDNGSTDIDILDATEYALIKYANYLMAG
jgi:phage terminase large subunit